MITRQCGLPVLAGRECFSRFSGGSTVDDHRVSVVSLEDREQIWGKAYKYCQIQAFSSGDSV